MDRQTQSPDVESTRAFRSGVASSPTQVPTRSGASAFDMQKPPSKSLPNFKSNKQDTTGCPCANDCKQPCCMSTIAMIKARTGDSEDRQLLSPIEHTIQRASSPINSYGSVDSSPASSQGSADSKDQLLGEQEPALRVMSPGGGPSYTVQNSNYDSDAKLEASVRCGCHVVVKDSTSKVATVKLIIASVIALVFMIGEVIGGYFAGSLAIMTDAAHMMSDLAGFLISLFAIWVGSQPPSKRMSFGWYRAEVIGAIVSVLIVWVMTGVLFYEAIQRVINPDLIDVKADIMLITACVGVFVNVFMCAVLGHGHGHSHGGGGHGHSHGGSSKKKRRAHDTEEGVEDTSRLGRLKQRLRRNKKKETSENINVRAAFVHVIGDLIQSIGVVIAGYIIWIRPDWKVADPICTFLFCVLVLFSTINVLKDALRVLMEATPKNIDFEEVKDDLQDIAGVKQAHSLHIWSLTTTRIALAAHLAIEQGANIQEVLNNASKMLKENHNIVHSTLQVEEYHDLMNDCGTCQQNKKKSLCWPW